MWINKNSFCYKLMSVLVLMIGLIMPFFLMRYSINFSDEPYQIMNAMDYHQNPSTIFSAYIYHLFGNYCGFELLTMRIFMAIIMIITMAIPIYYYYSERKNVWETMCVGGLAILLMSGIQQKSSLVGWDILSYLCLCVSTGLMLLYVKKYKSIGVVALMGVFIAMATMSRIPNIVIVPIALWCVLNDKGDRMRARKNTLTFLLTFIFSVLIIIWITYGDVKSYIDAWYDWGVSSEHGLLHMLVIHLKDIRPPMLLMGLCVLLYLSIYAITRYDERLYSKKRIIILVAFWLILLFSLCYEYEHLNSFTNNLITSSYLLMLIYIWLKNRRENNFIKDKKLLLIVLLSSLVPAIGSNTGWFKIANIISIVFLLPMFLPIASKTAKDVLLILIGAILLYFPINKAREMFFDEGLAQCTERLDLPNLRGIYTTPANNETLMSVYDKEKDSSAKDVLFVGFGRQLFEYMLECRANYAQHDFYGTIEDEKYISATKEYLDKNSTIKRVYIVNRLYMYYSDMDTMLVEKGYSLTDEQSCYRIYEKSNLLDK